MIGILTFYNTINYGAILQAYALQKKINSFTVENEIIRYECKAIREREISSLSESFRSMKTLLKYLLINRYERIKKQKFESFTREYLSLSEQVYKRDNIVNSMKTYDSYIVGSDQVWNLNLTGEDYSFFLDFESNGLKKNAYAGSFGYSTIPVNYKERCAQLLSNFSISTVREETGKNIIKQLLDKEVPVVLDPTLLLQSHEWLELVDDTLKYNNYILLYFIHNKNETFEYARRLAKKTGYKLVYINISPKPGFGMINLRALSPIEFLNLFKNAKYIITGSFHGVAFSINFNKKFFFEKDKKVNSYNSRIENLISTLHLEEREIGILNNMEQDINYLEVDRKLEELRKESLTYLMKMI
jgi:hypothetical protein